MSDLKYASCFECPHKIRCSLMGFIIGPKEQPFQMHMSLMMCYDFAELDY